MKRIKLKPCPLCGNEPMEFVRNDGLNIQCTKCRVGIFRAFVPAGAWETAAKNCRLAWNKRVG